ncbi:MAG: hypothetical protein HN760_04580 [Microbacteriaceae bacterium]|nr:hypothetical protein [Microbacteriaceae bacterium]MBT7803489.1 hypothetical protein [Microbacteriaceae bacterium]MDA9786923.1 hypothetical protein [Pontimonas sp.]
MNEKDLVELWNDKRRQIISAQMPSVIALAVITVMAMMGYFDGEYSYAQSFAAIFLVTVGSLSVLNQLAVIREAQTIVKDLEAVDNPSALARTIASSGSYLIYTRILMVVFSLALLAALTLLIL